MMKAIGQRTSISHTNRREKDYTPPTSIRVQIDWNKLNCYSSVICGCRVSTWFGYFPDHFIHQQFICELLMLNTNKRYLRTFHVAFHVRTRIEFTFCKQFMKFFSLEHRMIWYVMICYDGSYVIHLSCLQNVRGGGQGWHLHITKRASPFVSTHIMFCSDWTNWTICYVIVFMYIPSIWWTELNMQKGHVTECIIDNMHFSFEFTFHRFNQFVYLILFFMPRLCCFNLCSHNNNNILEFITSSVHVIVLDNEYVYGMMFKLNSIQLVIYIVIR